MAVLQIASIIQTNKCWWKLSSDSVYIGCKMNRPSSVVHKLLVFGEGRIPKDQGTTLSKISHIVVILRAGLLISRSNFTFHSISKVLIERLCPFHFLSFLAASV